MGLLQQPDSDDDQHERADAPTVVPPFDEVYSAHFDFVWRTLRRLGVPEAALDDAAQDVFFVVHRRLPEFEGRSSVKTWLFAIVRKTARNHRPSALQRHSDPSEKSILIDTHSASPLDSAERSEGARLLHALLGTLDDDKREAFILAEIEQMTVPEVAEALGVNLHTAYSRVRAARQELEQALARLAARNAWRGA